MKTPEQYAVCRVNGYLGCSEPDCLGGRRAHLPAYGETVTLRHEWGDQYVGILDDGRDFIRESAANWQRYLVATSEPVPSIRDGSNPEEIEIFRLCQECAFSYMGGELDMSIGSIVAFKVTELAECQGLYGDDYCDYRDNQA